MIRFACIAAVTVVLLADQSPAKIAPVIQWQTANGPYGGGARSLLVHRNQLLVPAEGGVWRSADRGTSWRVMAGRFADGWGLVQSGPDLFIQDPTGVHRTATLGASWVACGALPSRTGGDRRLVPAGERLFYWIPKVGLFRSHDRCASWTPVPVPWTWDSGAIQFVVSRGAGPMFVMTLRGSFRTADHGATWERIATPPRQTFTSVPDSGSGVLIGTGDGVYRSTDGGVSWTQLGFARRWVRNMVVGKAGEVYAAVEDASVSPTRTTMMRSLDDGRTWTSADEGLSGHLITGLARDDSGAVYAASTTGVYRLGGAGRWQHVGLPTFLVASLFGAPWGDVYATAASLGAYRTADLGASWRPLLLPEEFAGPIIVTKEGDLLLAISQSVYRSRDRGETWQETGLHHQTIALLAAPSGGVILAATHDGVFRSLDNGETWVEPSIGPRSSNVTSFAASADGVLFAAAVPGEGEGEVYRSTDRGDRWHRLAPEFPVDPVNAMVVLPAGDVVAATDSGIFRWAPDDPRWQKVELRRRQTSVSSLVVDSSGRLIAGTPTAGVFVSEDRGRTWTPANLGLPTLRVRALAATSDGALYVAAGRGFPEGRATDPGGPVGIFRGRFASR